jgi:4-hydroxy-2-oxoheptanedioate aldolase
MKNLRQALAAGEKIIGPFCVSNSPTLVEVVGYAGFDFVIIDCEHASTSATGSELENMVRAAYAADIVPIVRTTKNNSSQILKAFNFGAQAVIIPHVNTRDDAQAAVKAGKYAPVGQMSCAPPVRAAKHGFIEWHEFYEKQLRETMVIPLIEEDLGLSNVESIASVPGVGGIFFGPFDLAVSRGSPAGVYDLKTHATERRTVYECAKKNKLPVVDLAWDIASAQAMLALGADMIALGTDITMFANSCKDLKKQAEEIKRAAAA